MYLQKHWVFPWSNFFNHCTFYDSLWFNKHNIIGQHLQLCSVLENIIKFPIPFLIQCFVGVMTARDIMFFTLSPENYNDHLGREGIFSGKIQLIRLVMFQQWKWSQNGVFVRNWLFQCHHNFFLYLAIQN